ncbi:2-polyprenylphenol 6-hydroxylase [Pseudovibrio sp. Tun.PSC04-5.I4]|uniref:2-polyprenylphenol 6-hydroxylase n=1 Tax=Pseudovibrio sp. Tun.PSC04-5.I4 TaxID=1798213 RepID=UPI00088592BA|nr:2-polyprenylphenol 6-hydroxylase [Pseudovibrio sp. Tun.PSC04-5.I4]SDR25012.1 2-octaprenylphenol hydroxylase [Pseudovibrio sp. Tun.PSC04-5.I4]
MIASILPLLRLIYAGFVMAREGVFGLVSLPDLPPGPRLAIGIARLAERRGVEKKDAAARLTVALNRLGPSYIKLGQFLATRPDVVGKEAAKELSELQDNVPAFAIEHARKTIEEQLGGNVEDHFEEFGEPVAAASIAQVHPAYFRNRDGDLQKVAVKVLRPGVERGFKRDLKSFYLAAGLAERFSAASRRLRPLAMVETYEAAVHLEMDLRMEAAALSEMGENSKEDESFRVPSVEWARTSRSVLCMEWIDGVKLSNVEGIKEAGHDLAELGNKIIQSFLRHAVRDGFFHADMHQGNLFVEADGTLVAVDLGITGRLGFAERRFLAEILYGFITRNYVRVAEVHFEAGYVPADQDVNVFAQAIRAIGEPIHGHDASEISMARLLTQLFEVTEMFNMHTQPQLILLQKNMVLAEGVARSLNPHLDMWNTADPVVTSWIQRNLGPMGRISDLATGLTIIGRLATDLPIIADRASKFSNQLEAMANNGLRFDEATTEAIGKSEAKHSRSSRVALWVIAIALSVIAYSTYT